MNLPFPADQIAVGHVAIDARLRPGLRIHPTDYVASNANVIGDASLMEESRVWCAAVIAGDLNRFTIGPCSIDSVDCDY